VPWQAKVVLLNDSNNNILLLIKLANTFILPFITHHLRNLVLSAASLNLMQFPSISFKRQPVHSNSKKVRSNIEAFRHTSTSKCLKSNQVSLGLDRIKTKDVTYPLPKFGSIVIF
jgi:hypothetical protein